MDQHWRAQGDGEELLGGGTSDPEYRDMEEEEEASEEEEEDDEEELVLEAARPLKRGKHSLAHLSVAMGAAGVGGGRGQDSGGGAAIPSDEEEDDEEGEDEDEDEDDQDDGENEVIEILDDDEELEDHDEDQTTVSPHGQSTASVSQPAPSFRDEVNTLSSEYSNSASLLERRSSSRPAPALARDAMASARTNRRDRPPSWTTSIPDLERMLGVRSPSPPFGLPGQSLHGAQVAPSLGSRTDHVADSKQSLKLSPEELNASEVRDAVLPARTGELEQPGVMPETLGNDTNSVSSSRPRTSSAGTASSTMSSATATHTSNSVSGADGACASPSSEFPMELECTFCFLPIAVIALFACGHGCCWECAHDWCSRGTSPTMDCPTCHVSVPRNDFRRCVLFDEVVERAVCAAGCLDDTWEKRLSRGKQLAQEVESRRRSKRDAQRAMEDKKAAELERHREEMRARAPARQRSFEYLQNRRSDYSFLLPSRDLWAESQSQMEEPFVGRIVRQRRPDVDPPNGVLNQRGTGLAPGNPAVATAAAGNAVGEGNTAVTMTAMGLNPAAPFGASRPRGLAHAGPFIPPTGNGASVLNTSGVGLPGGEPWFSLRPYSNSREAGSMGALGGGVSVEGHKDTFPGAANAMRNRHRFIPECSLTSNSVQGVERHGNSGVYPNRRDTGRGDAESSQATMVGGDRFSRGAQAEPPSTSIRGRAMSSSVHPMFNIPGPPGAQGRRPASAGQVMPAAITAAAAAAAAVGGMGGTVHAVPNTGRYSGKRPGLPVPPGPFRDRSRSVATRAGSTMLSAVGVSPRAGTAQGSAGATMPFHSHMSLSVGLLGTRGEGRRESLRGNERDGAGNQGGNAIGGNDGMDAALAMAATGVEDAGPNFDPLDVVSQNEDFGTRSEWDDVLEAVSLPQQASPEGVRRSASPGSHHE